MKKITGLLLVGAICLIQSCNDSSTTDSVDKANNANDNKDTTSMKEAKKDTVATPVNGDVADFAVKAANGGMAEVKMGKIAMERGMSKEVKDFGAMMVKDHTQANDELMALAGKKSITLPADVSNDMQSNMDDLNKKSGKDFDKAYVNMMVSDHKNDIDEFEKASKDLKDPEFQAFTSKTLPVLYKHQNAIKAIQKANNY